MGVLNDYGNLGISLPLGDRLYKRFMVIEITILLSVILCVV